MKILLNAEISISNAQGEFEILDGVCGEIVLQFVTTDGETYTKKYDRKHIPEVIELSYKSKRNYMQPVQEKCVELIFLEHPMAECSFILDISNLNGNQLPINVNLKA